jgi:hypothetical protein
MPSPDRSSMSPLAEHYYRNWQTEQLADGLEQFLARHHDLNTVQLVEVLLVDQALEWQSEPGPSVEQYLRRFPIVAEQHQAVLDLVYGEIRAVRALGLPADVDAYGVRFPNLTAPLRRQVEVSAWLTDEGQDTQPGDRRPPS